MTYLSQFLQKFPEVDLNENIKPVLVAPLYQAKPIDSSKLFEEQILSHECKLVQDFIDKVYITGINLSNLHIYMNQFNNLQAIFEKAKNGLSPEYQTKWQVIKEELAIANQIQDWIRAGEQQMLNYSIPCSYDECKQQLATHCDYFSNDLKLKQQPVLIGQLVDSYGQCADDVQKWRAALEKAAKMWQVYESSKRRLMAWLQEADALLLKSHEPKLDKPIRRQHLENLKNFFGNRTENEKILKEFIVACENVLSTLPEEEPKSALRSTLTGLVNRFYNIINYSAPQHLVRFEFEFVECDFFDKVRSMQRLAREEQPSCESSIVDDLAQLERLGTTFWNTFDDKSLLDRAIKHRMEWDKFKKRLQENADMVNRTAINLQGLVREAEYSVNLAKNNDLKSDILQHNESLFRRIHAKLADLRNLEKASQLGIGNDLAEIKKQIDRLLLDLNTAVEDKILNWCKVKDRSRLPSPDGGTENANNQRFQIQKIDFYSKLVSEFEKYEGLIARSKQLIDELSAKLDELAARPTSKSIDEIAINYKVCSHTIDSTIEKILEELREINRKLRDHNCAEELHANEILNELRRLRQRNEEQYGYLVDSFSKDLLKQIETYRTKCEHCKEIADLRNLLIEVRNLNTTSVHKLEHLNLNDACLHGKLLGSLEELIKLIDEKCGLLMAGPKEDDQKRSVRITTELTQKKIIEEIDGKGERSNRQISEYYKDLSNVNPFYQTPGNTTTAYTTASNTTTVQQTETVQQAETGQQPARPSQNDFGQQFNEEHLGVKQEILLKSPDVGLRDEPPSEPEPEQPSKQKRKESFELEAERERERIEAEYKKEQERIENELRKERERLEEQEALERERLEVRRLQIEEDARREREKAEEDMRKEKERLEQQRLIEKDNELIEGLDESIERLNDQIASKSAEQISVDELRNCLNGLKQLCIQAKYVKDTQLNDKEKIKEFEGKLNETTCKVLALIESKISNELGPDNFDLGKIETANSLNENIGLTEYGFGLISTYLQCRKAFNDSANWIENAKEKINFLPYETIENLIDQYKRFVDECGEVKKKLDDTSEKLNAKLKYSNIIKTPYLARIEQLNADYTDKCKELFDDFLSELNDKALDIEQQAKECDSFNDFQRVNQELVKLKKSNEPVLEKVKQEPKLEIAAELSKIDSRLDELGKKLDGILDEKAVELVRYGEFTLEPSDLEVEFDNLQEKSDHYSRLQNEIEHYKDLLIDNEIFLENLRKKLSEVNLKPVEQAIRSCQNYAENISNQINKLQNSLKNLNQNLQELGCLQELKCTEAIDELNKLKTDYEQKLDQLIDELVGLVAANLAELQGKNENSIKEVELKLANLDQLAGKFEAKVNKLNIQQHPSVERVVRDLADYKQQLNDQYEYLKEQERLKEEEERLKEEEQRSDKERKEKERKEKERLKKLEEERKLEEDRRLEKEREERKKEEEKLKEKQEEKRRQEERAKEEEQRELKRKEEKRKEEEAKLKQQDDLSDLSSANNLSKNERDENDNLSEKKLKKVINKQPAHSFDQPEQDERNEEPIAVVQVRTPKISKALLTSTAKMHSVEHYSEADSVDGEPIIELADSDAELNGYDRQADGSILDEIRTMLEELKDNRTRTSNLADLIDEMNQLKNVALKVEDVRPSKQTDGQLNNQLNRINDQLGEIFGGIKDLLNSQIPNLQESAPSEDSKDLLDSINLYTEIVTEFDKFDSLVNSNNEFINEIRNQLRQIDNKSLDSKLLDYRDLLGKITGQINSVSDEISSLNENLQDLKCRDGLDERRTLEELEKLRKLCEDHMENSIEDLYISYIPKITALEDHLSRTQRLAELESILEQMSVLKEEINEKVDRLDLNGSPLIKNLLDLVEKLKNKIEAKIEDLIYREAGKEGEDNSLNEQTTQSTYEQALYEQANAEEIIKLTLKRPLNARNLANNLDNIEFSVQKTPDATAYRPEHAAAIFKRQPSFDRPDTLQFTPPVLPTLHDQQHQTTGQPVDASPQADRQLDEVLRKLKNLKDSLSAGLNYDQTKAKMNDLIELISTIQSINERKPSQRKLQEVTGELDEVVDRLTKVTYDYIRKVCEQENTRPDKSIDENLKSHGLDRLLDNLRPRYESITEYRKFERLTEDNRQKVDALNKVIDELANLPINQKVKNLKVSTFFGWQNSFSNLYI